MRPTTVWLVLAAATAVAAALRFPFLDHQSLWLDEIYTRDILKASSITDLWQHVEATESTPPLYYVLGWLLGARSAVAIRVIPALALTGSVPVAYLAVRYFVGQRAALATAAILAVSPMLVSYSTDGRSYGLFVFTALLSLWGFATVLEHGGRRQHLYWLLGSVLCVWTHYFGAFLIAGEALLLLRSQRPRLRTLLFSLLIGLCLIPLIPLIVHQSGSERAEFIAEIHLSSRILTTVREFAMGANVPRTWLEAAGLALWIAGAAWGLARATFEASGARTLLVLATVTIGVPMLLAVTGIDDRFYARNLILALPLLIAVAAPALLRGRGIALAAYLLVATLASLWVATNWRYEQPDWRDAIATVKAVEPRAPVFAVTFHSGLVAETYLGRAPTPAPGLSTQTAWIVVEPTRPAKHRALTPASVPVLQGFSILRTLQTHGFELALVHANRPTPVSASSIPSSVLFPSAG